MVLYGSVKLFEYFLKDVPQNIQNTGYLIFLVVCLLLGIFTIYLFRKKENFYSLEPSNCKAGEGKKLIWFLTSTPIIIYTILCLRALPQTAHRRAAALLGISFGLLLSLGALSTVLRATL